MKVLFAGEGIYTCTTIFKGWDQFTLGAYSEEAHYFMESLNEHGIKFDYIPTNRAQKEFPWTEREMNEYDAIILSDLGSNTLTLTNECYRGERTPNRMIELEKYVRNGKGFVMFGGYLSFTGLWGRGFYKRTPIEKLLPVELMETDDRIECPEGVTPKIIEMDHPILKDIPKVWPCWFVSLNRLKAKEDATVLAVVEEYEDTPFLVVHQYGKGRSVASGADCAPHGATPSFFDWEYRSLYFANIVRWAAGEI
jgi:uncharacterized membrane protein